MCPCLWHVCPCLWQGRTNISLPAVCMYVCMYVFTGTPMAASFAMKDFDLLFDHVVYNFRERLKCTCGAGV